MSQRKRPAPPQDRPSRNHSPNATKSTAHRSEDGYAAPTAEDRREAQLLAELRECGYRPAVRCTRCNQWVVADASVAAHMGPVCRSKVVAE